jgi:signal-transduction protein with cAMP-binding, CBS, and nucleotidyltransferase domain
LADRGVVSPTSREELFTVYDFLMQTRLQVQMSAIEHHQLVTNRVRVNQLGYMQREQLKQSLIQIEAIQKKISYDFLGGLA